MKKLLISSAALAFSTSFAFAVALPPPPPPPTISVRTGNNHSYISNHVNHNFGSDILVANGVNQNTGLQIPILIIGPRGPLGGGGMD